MPITSLMTPAVTPAERERGFTLVELLIVMLIIGIILATLISTFRGSKKATYAKAGQVSAFNYQDAVEAYMADNGQRAPVMGEEREWPVIDAGPIDPQFTNKPYMRTVPEHVKGGMVDIVRAGEPWEPNAQTIIEYTAGDGAPGYYTFQIWVREGGAETKKNLACIITNRAQIGRDEKRCVS